MRAVPRRMGMTGIVEPAIAKDYAPLMPAFGNDTETLVQSYQLKSVARLVGG